MRGAAAARGARTAAPGAARAALALLGVLAASACASTPDPPDPVADPDTPAAAAGGAARPAVPELQARMYPRPPRPWVRPTVALSPPGPRAGTALGIVVSVPCAARRPRAVEGRLGDREVSFGPLGDAWFGMAALPAEEAGEMELSLHYRLTEDSTVVASVPVTVRDRTYPTSRLSVDPRYSSPPAEVRDRIERERRLVADVLSRRTGEWLLTDDVRWPRPPRITSSFGERRTFNEEVRSRHWGVDLRGGRGDPVRAAARGRVALVRELYYAGRAVYVDHGRGVFTGYFHLSRPRVREGETVEPGDVIGEVGATGRVTGPHLHWTLHVNGTSVDARSLLSLEIPSSPAPGTADAERTACSLPG